MARERTLVHIRERSFLDVLDLALVVVRRRPLVVGLTAALGIAPWAALNAWLIAAFPDVPGWPFLLLLAIEAPWATAPLTVMLGGLMFGERPSAGRVARTLLRSLPAMVLYQGVLRSIPVLSHALYPLIPARWAFLNEVLLLERTHRRKPGEPRPSALARSAQLSGGRESALFGQWLTQVFFGGLFVISFQWAAATMIVTLFGELGWSNDWEVDPLIFWLFDFKSGLGQLGVWISVGFFGVVRFLNYIDQRIRLEGWEVELRLRAAGEALEDPERW